MNELEYQQWRTDAKEALSKRYNLRSAETVLQWFDRITGSSECDLIGGDRLEAFSVFSCSETMDNKWCLYDSLMSRLWIYAPYILAESDVK